MLKEFEDCIVTIKNLTTLDFSRALLTYEYTSKTLNRLIEPG